MKLRILTTLLMVLSATATQAHFVWIELPPQEQGKAFMRLAEAPLEKTNQKLQELCAPMSVTTLKGQMVDFLPGDDKRVAEIDKNTPLLLGNLEYGIMDRRESGGDRYLLQYHAKAARSLVEAGKETSLPVDILATVKDDSLIVTVRFKGKAYEGSELTLDLPGALEQLKGTTDAQGQATFPVESGGWIGVRAMVPETISGEFDGESYEKSRHYGTLAVPYPTR